MEIQCSDIMNTLMRTVIGKKTIGENWLLDNGNPGNKNYFNTRIKKETPFNDTAITKMIDCMKYHLGKNEIEENIMDENTCISIANRLQDYIKSLEIDNLPDLTNSYGNEMNPVYRTGLLMMLNSILQKTLNKNSISSEQLNAHFQTVVLPALHKLINTSTLNDSIRNQTEEKISQLITSGVLTYTPEKSTQIRKSIPPCITSFIGRTNEIQEIHNALTNEGYAILEGIGGIGKSELAKKYVKSYCSYYDQIVWANYNNSITETISLLPSDEDCFYKNESNKERYQRKLSRLIGDVDSQTLLIIDNYSSVNNDELFDIIGYEFDIIITTRQHIDDSILIPPLSSEDALTLFYKHYRKNTSKDDMSVIINLLEKIDYHTLLIELFAKLLQKSNMTPKELLAQINQNININNSTTISIKKDNSQKQDIVTCHISSLLRLEENKKLLPKESEYIFAALSLIPSSGMFLDDFALILSQENYNKIWNLYDYGWIQIDNNNVINCHILISDTIYTHYKDRQSIFQIPLNNWRTLLNSITSKATYDSYHNQLICNYLLRVNNKFIFLQEAWCYFLDFASAYLVENHRYDDAFALVSNCIKIIPKIKYKDIYSPVMLYSNIASIYESVCDYENAQLYQNKAVNLKQELDKTHKHNNDNFIESMLYETSATLAFNKGNIDEAFEIYNTKVDTNLLSDTTLSSIYIYQNDIIKAIETAQKNLELTLNRCGLNSKYTAQKYSSLALCQSYNKQYEASFKNHEKAIEILTNLNYIDTIEMANAKLTYAISLCISGNINQSLQYLQDADSIYPESYRNNEDVIELYLTFSDCYNSLCKYDLSLEYLHKAYSTLVNNAMNSPKLINVCCKIGGIYQGQGKYTKAINYYEKAISIINAKKVTAYPDLDIGDLSLRCGVCYAFTNDYTNAKENLDVAEIIFEKKQDWEKLEFTMAFSGKLSFTLGYYQETIKKFQESLDCFNQHQDFFYDIYKNEGKIDISKFNILISLSEVCRAIGNLDAFLQLSHTAIIEYEKHPLKNDKEAYDTTKKEYGAVLILCNNEMEKGYNYVKVYENALLSQTDYNDFDIYVLKSLQAYYSHSGNQKKCEQISNILIRAEQPISDNE